MKNILKNNSLFGLTLLSLTLVTGSGLYSSPARAVDALAGIVGDTIINVTKMPQIDGLLPYIDTVPPGKYLPIDGIWTISTIGKRIKIDRGRAYALDGWNFSLIFRIQPNMVTMINISQTDTDTYSGDDLPLTGKAILKRLPDGRLHGKMLSGIPYEYYLIPDPSNVDHFQSEVSDEEQSNQHSDSEEEYGYSGEAEYEYQYAE